VATFTIVVDELPALIVPSEKETHLLRLLLSKDRQRLRVFAVKVSGISIATSPTWQQAGDDRAWAVAAELAARQIEAHAPYITDWAQQAEELRLNGGYVGVEIGAIGPLPILSVGALIREFSV